MTAVNHATITDDDETPDAENADDINHVTTTSPRSSSASDNSHELECFDVQSRQHTETFRKLTDAITLLKKQRSESHKLF
jgi:hypothetical protein